MEQNGAASLLWLCPFDCVRSLRVTMSFLDTNTTATATTVAGKLALSLCFFFSRAVFTHLGGSGIFLDANTAATTLVISNLSSIFIVHIRVNRITKMHIVFEVILYYS